MLPFSLTIYRVLTWPQADQKKVARFARQVERARDDHDISELEWRLIEERAARREGVDGPIAFERWCARTLENSGWSATVTKSSGDQGADVLARKGQRSIILQCKLYSSPVGNKAVQEAFAAQRHYVTRKSAVVTNAEFTRSARELAASTKVLLLHYSDLSRIDEMISSKGN